MIAVLESHARHLHAGTHDAVTADPARNGLFAESPPGDGSVGELTETQRAILDALSEPRSAEDVGERVGLDAGPVRAELTMLELAGRVRRRGGLFERGR